MSRECFFNVGRNQYTRRKIIIRDYVLYRRTEPTNNELSLTISRCKDKDNFRNRQILCKKNFQKPLFLTSVNSCTQVIPKSLS